MLYRYFEVTLLAETLRDENDIDTWYVRSSHKPSPAAVLDALHDLYPAETNHFCRVDSIEEVDAEEAAMNTRCPLERFVTIAP